MYHGVLKEFQDQKKVQLETGWTVNSTAVYLYLRAYQSETGNTLLSCRVASINQVGLPLQQNWGSTCVVEVCRQQNTETVLL